MVTGSPAPRRLTLAAVALVHALALWWLARPSLLALAPERPAMETLNVPLPLPPPPAPKADPVPPPQPRPEPKRAPEPEAKAAPKAKRAEPTPVVAPVPVVEPEPVPLVAAEEPGEASAPVAGAAEEGEEAYGGAGGEGDGRGSGLGGAGSGGGGLPVTRARRIAGDIGPRDLPAAIRRVRTLRSTTAHFSVLADGRVRDCRVVQSSGDPMLDDLTCGLIEDRFRYAPARDARGRPVEDIMGYRQEWWMERRR